MLISFDFAAVSESPDSRAVLNRLCSDGCAVAVVLDSATSRAQKKILQVYGLLEYFDELHLQASTSAITHVTDPDAVDYLAILGSNARFRGSLAHALALRRMKSGEKQAKRGHVDEGL